MPSSINHVLYDDEKCEGCKKLMADCVCFECPTCHGTGLVNPLSPGARQGFLLCCNNRLSRLRRQRRNIAKERA